MPLRFQYRPLRGLPKLAWLAVTDPSADGVTVYHGSAVETHERFFIEGAWNGPFPEGAFAATDCVFGSGATAAGGRLTFVSSAATTDYLYYRHREAGLAVSNSLPFLLAFTGDELDPQCRTYDRINASITLGINRYIREIPTRQGSVVRLMHRNLEVSGAEASEVEKPWPPPFAGFGEYSSYLERNYALIAGNIRDPARAVRLGIYSTQSKGYDTTAINAIARRDGIDVVFTVSQGKAAGRFADHDAALQVDDDGTEICRALGLEHVVALDRHAFEREYDAEYLFYATLDDTQDANFLEIGRHLNRPGVLLTGTLGEIWYPACPHFERDHPHSRGPDLERWDPSTHSLTEFRLSAGFVLLPLAYIGARRREDILRITASEEMKPWSLDSTYNRPIPRRIGEEAGVPRGLFGQKKMASVVEFAFPRVPYGLSLRAQYRRFLIGSRVLPAWKWALLPLVRRINAALGFAGPSRLKGIYYLERAISRLVRRNYRFPQLWGDLKGRIFCFCANKRAADYAACLRESK